MLGKLKKHEKSYSLVVDDVEMAIYDTERTERPLYSLSKQNCETIERGYNLDELVNEAIIENIDKSEQVGLFDIGFEKGFKKALSIRSDKNFSEEDIRKAFNIGWIQRHNEKGSHYEIMEKVIQSLQKNEFEVEIVMEDLPYSKELSESEVRGFEEHSSKSNKPKLDSDGNLILKRI